VQQQGTTRTSHAVILLCALIAVSLYLLRGDGIRTRNAVALPGGEPAVFFGGAVIQWIVPNHPGGGYDSYARLVAPYLERYTGARVRVLNIPGAGGLRGLREIFRSPADGLTIGLINGSGILASQMSGIGGRTWEVGELSFLGRIVADVRVLVLSRHSAYTSFEDILQAAKPVRIGASGVAGSTYFDAVITREAFALNVAVTYGFDNTAALRQAMLMDNIDGSWTSWGSARDAAASGQVRPVLQGGRTRASVLPDVPTAFEFTGRSADPAHAGTMLGAWEALNEVGRTVVAPPGLPADRLRYLREALGSALRDPALREDIARAGRFVAYASGEEIAAIVRDVLAIPAPVRRDLARATRSELQ
jgi:tripartite-type tricarboxylate transporter receptor subunit TctC